MSTIDRPGTFRGVITQSGISNTQSKLPQFVAKFRALELYDNSEIGNEQWVDWSEFEENEITGYFCMVSKKGEPIGFQIENLMKALGWSGASFEELATSDYSSIQVQFRVESNTYEGKTRLQVVSIDHADTTPGGSLRTLDVSDIKKLDAKFASKLKKLSGGPKPKAVGKPAKPDKPADPTPVPDSSPPAKEPPVSEDSKPKKSKASKPPRPGKGKKGEPASIAERLNLPSLVDEDAAWEQVMEYKSSEFNEDNAAEAWLEAVDTLGSATQIDKENAWAQVRDIVLEKLTDDPSF